MIDLCGRLNYKIMQIQTLKSLQNLAKMLGGDKVLVKDEVEEVLGGIFNLLAEYKKTTDAMNSETRTLVDKLLNQSLDIYVKLTEETKAVNKKQNDMTANVISEAEKKLAQKVEEVKYLISQVEMLEPRDGMDADEEAIIERVLATLAEQKKAHELTEMYQLDAADIADAINNSENEEDKIDFARIKNVPASILNPKSTNSGAWSFALRNAIDLDMSTRADGYGIVWDETAGRFKFSASGGGGGSGTVNSGTANRLTYYASTGTAVSALAAITASRLLVSNASGLPTHSAVTATEAGYLAGVTSAIQTQLDGKQATLTIGSVIGSATAGSILFAGSGGAIAQDNASLFFDDTFNRLGVGTNAPEYVFHTVGGTAGGFAMFERTTTATTGSQGTIIVLARTSNTMANTFGAQMTYAIEDSDNVLNGVAATVGAMANSQDNSGNYSIYTASAGTLAHVASAGFNGTFSIGGSAAITSGSRLDVSVTRSASNTGNVGVNFSTRSGTFTDTSSSGTVSVIYGHSLYLTTFAASAATTYTTAATLYINGAPAAGTNVTITNAYAIHVAAGAVRIDGTIELGNISDTTLSRSSAGILAVEGVAVPTISSTHTLTNKRITRRVQTVASSATVTPSADSDDDVVITAQAAGLTIANPTGTPTEAQTLTIRVKDNGTTRTIAFGAAYRAIGVTLPTATTASKTIYIGCKYNSTDTKWDVNAVATEA
jgi:hypothetical protein